jgi:signal transduction histidine kinase
MLSAFAVYLLKFRNDTINREKFANQLLVENDVLGEYLLNEASMYIKNDQFIQSVLLNPFTGKEVIEQKIKRVYLGTYFDKYEINVFVFDALGNAFNLNQEFNYWPDVIDNYKLPQFRTDYPNIYLLYDAGNQDFRRYLSFVKIRKGGAVIGYILVELKQKRILPHSVYPELLVDEKFIQPFEKDYSYVIYGQNGIVNSHGEFNYEKYFEPENLRDFKSIFEEGITRKGFHHIAIRGAEGKVVIVSSKEYSWEKFFSNFSFNFFVLMFFILLLIVISSVLIGYNRLDFSFSTKIQIYLNLAFFLPLIIVSITTLSIISTSYKDNLNQSFIKKAESVSNAIYTELESDGQVTADRLEEVLNEKSRFMETDINYFDNKGRLVFSNQPIIYDAGLFAKVANPEALSRIQDYKNNIFMLPEKVGGFNYNSVYIAIKSYGTGNLLGILSIPFFESKQELDKQIIDVLTTILNIFVSIFLVFLLLSYLVSKLLTVPLDMITQKLRRTNLSTQNEPIAWNSHDEIGLLIGEYNRMLVKLEESKDALSRSEKESAWREMAQQVAHEIKNPLTPMKLSIQHLQRALKDKRDNINEMFEKSLPVLLDQVNTLSEIATSFSAFAKMPIPKHEHFEITGVFASITRLHSADQNVSLKVKMAPGPVFITGDQQLLGNIISNLIINAIQSVPAGRVPEIEADLIRSEKFIQVRIKDNGTGIPESIREKVFLPNFSTKYSGSGLGLALAKRGVEHAGGKIWFETIEGTGTTFFIELPIAE